MLPISPFCNRLVVFHADDFEESAVFVEMHAGLVPALESPHAHLVRAVHVVDIAAPKTFELVAEGIIGVGPKPATEKFRLQIPHVKIQFVARDLGKLGGVFRPHVPDIGAPFLRDLDLAPR